MCIRDRFTVVKPVRLPIPALLSALRVRRALHPRGAPAALVRVVVPVKRLLPQFLTFLIYLRVQFAQICLRRNRYFRQLLLVLVRLRLDVRRIRIQDRSAQGNNIITNLKTPLWNNIA